MKVFAYKNCSTCRNAIKWLESHNLVFDLIPIRENPPSIIELEKVLKLSDLPLNKLFNSSGQDYRRMDMKNRLPEIGKAEALKLLSENGNLVKRPILLDDKVALVGFKEAEWSATLGS